MLVTEEEVEVLEGLCQEEGLLHIILLPPNLERVILTQIQILRGNGKTKKDHMAGVAFQKQNFTFL